MKKESERMVNGWKMKTGKNRKLELGQVAQGWDRKKEKARETEKGQCKETRLAGELHYRTIFWQKTKISWENEQELG